MASPEARISSEVDPSAPAVIMAESGQTITFGELESRSRRLAHLFRDRGLKEGSHIAVLLDNNPAYYDPCFAAQRSGMYFTPINWHLGQAEAGYILTDCDAEALVTTSHLGELASSLGDHMASVTTRLAVDGPVEGFENYDDAVAGQPDTPLPEEHEGAVMFYSSGTTGRPKGIVAPLSGRPFGSGSPLDALVRGMYGFRPGIVYLCPAPLYHAAPLGWSMAALRVGGTVVVMERFDPAGVLRAIERYRVTHAQFVPTHFIRMLKLSEEERTGYELSSLETVIHAAAPCPVEVKRQMIEWWGPIIYEYYSASEGIGFCAVSPQEWLERPGTVGKAVLGVPHILDEDGKELPTGEIGQIWFETAGRIQYHKDAEKTASVYNDRGWGTLGDVGYLDDDGYVYLTDRVSHMIISGGVNIYPQEIEDVLVVHPAVADAGVIGVPDPEMGESVLAVVQLADPDANQQALARELDAWCRDHLAGFKCPRQFRFAAELPRLPTGKLLKRRLREEYGGASAASVRSADGQSGPKRAGKAD